MFEITLPTVIVAFLGSNVITALITWWQLRPVNASTAKKQNAEAYSAMHDSNMSALQISSAELAIWMKTASDAEKKINALERQIANCICKTKGNGR